jgi:predicted nucleotidyltransferase
MARVKTGRTQEIELILDEIVEKLKAGYQPEKIVLYGSYAYGTPDEGSDIDLLVVKRTDAAPFDRRVAVRRIVDLRAPIPFESIVVTPDELAGRLGMGDPFFEEIMQKGKVLYAREGIAGPGRLVRKG